MKPEFEMAWGSPIKETHADKTLTLARSPDSKLTALQRPNPIPEVEAVVAKLKTIAAVIEADIAHFNTFKGQSMAVNRFSFLKRDILDNVARLEKACQGR